MIMFARYVLLLTSLLYFVSALPLTSRDVVDPPITSPKAGTVWQVGQTETVTWNATGLPANESNPVGMLILGFISNDSENLMLNSPLATNIDYSKQQVQIKVPDVPSGTNYIVVLFGDSGNASPEFTIINGASGTTSPTSVAPSPTMTGGSPTVGPTPAPSPTSPDTPNSTGGPSSSAVGALNTGSGSTGAAPSGSPTASSASTVVVTSSSTPSSTHSNAAWKKHAPGLRTCLIFSLPVIYLAFS